MNNTLVSIIIPVYNVENYIDECINSAVEQTYKNIEIIIVDDGSTDGSSYKCDIWKSNDERIKVYHKKNEGVSAARNFGINISTGKYIMFVDGDDYLPVKAIENLIDESQNCSLDIVIGNYEKIYPNKISTKHIINNTNKLEFVDFITKNYLWEIWGKLIKREKIINIFNTNYYVGEDMLFLVENFSNSNYKFVNKCSYFYRINNNSIMNRKVVSQKNITEFDALNRIIKITDGKDKMFFKTFFCHKLYYMKKKYDDKNKIFKNNKKRLLIDNKTYLKDILKDKQYSTLFKTKYIIKFIIVYI